MGCPVLETARYGKEASLKTKMKCAEGAVFSFLGRTPDKGRRRPPTSGTRVSENSSDLLRGGERSSWGSVKVGKEKFSLVLGEREWERM